jgi:hypothetical protein
MKCILTKAMTKEPNSMNANNSGIADGDFMYTVVFESEFNTI